MENSTWKLSQPNSAGQGSADEHWETCLAVYLAVCRARGLQMSRQHPEVQATARVWSAMLKAIPVTELAPTIYAALETYSSEETSAPFGVPQILYQWRQQQEQQQPILGEPESVREIKRMANCQHDYHWIPEAAGVVLGVNECSLCGHAVPQFALSNPRVAATLREGGLI